VFDHAFSSSHAKLGRPMNGVAGSTLATPSKPVIAAKAAAIG
jgi:hypothetical protein